MKIAVLGCNYQGLVTAAGLAENGHQVTCYCDDPEQVSALRSGTLPLSEPGLDELVASNLEEERLRFTGELATALADVLMVFVCLEVKADESGKPDLSPIFALLDAVATEIPGYRILVLRSVCPPGTGEAAAAELRSKGARDFDVVVNPDFLRQGSAIEDFMRPSHVIIGCDDVRVREIMKELYSPFLRTGNPLIAMGMRSAELCRYATSALLAARISMINQLASVCEAYGANVSEVRDCLAADDRIGGKYLFPGIGFGGAGLRQDLRVLTHLAHEMQVPADLLETVDAVNERQLEEFIARVISFYGDTIAEKRLAIWGASFKPRTADLRGAPGLRIIERLLGVGARVAVYDPQAGDGLLSTFGDKIDIARKPYEALEGADGLCIATEWSAFRRPDYLRMAELMRQRVIFDGRNLYTPHVMQEAGFQYFSVGRPAV